MKIAHEQRIERLTAMTKEMESHLILYGAKVGSHDSPLNYRETSNSILPDFYPSASFAYELGMSHTSHTDDTENYWIFQQEHLVNTFSEQIPRLRKGPNLLHTSVFALAPIPLLIRLGTLLGDIHSADVYERHREPKPSWKWPDVTTVQEQEFKIIPPKDFVGHPVLNISLSDNISTDRIDSVLKEAHSIWTLTIQEPRLGYMVTKNMLSKFRSTCRTIFDQIKKSYGQNAQVHIFPAMSVSCAIELGRVWMPKAGLKLVIYDHNLKINSFFKTITVS